MEESSAPPSSDISFIGIGAQKCASTWLWRNLYRHPRIWMPHVKELHYFDRSTAYPSPSMLHEERIRRRLFGREPHHAKWRRMAVRNVGESILRRDVERIRWDASYFLGQYDDTWYRSLFHPGEGQICGEITPSYALLTIEDVRRVHALAPRARILYILRDPVDRAWSQVRFDHAAGRVRALSDRAELERYVQSPTVQARGEYLKTFEKWSSVFGEENILLGYYDDIKTDPAAFLARVARFLDIDDDGFDLPMVQARVKVSTSRPIPEDMERLLSRLHLPSLESLAARFDGPPERWLERARRVSAGSAPRRTEAASGGRVATVPALT